VVQYEYGQKKEEGEYKSGKQEGPRTFWNEDGSINYRFSGIFKDGKRIADGQAGSAHLKPDKAPPGSK